MRTLYIVDGESSGGTLKRGLGSADILVWRDALYDGPVPGGLRLRELSRIRTKHWNAAGEFAKRDRTLATAAKFDEVVLWFGPTMVCQLSLLQLLDWFSRHRGCKLTLIDREYAGLLSPDRIAPELEKRRLVTPRMLRTGSRGWFAFTSSNPGALSRFLASDSADLPELRRVLQLVMEEYPDRQGLSRIERKLLTRFRQRKKAAVGVSEAMRDETFGDLYYFDALERFLKANNQLLRFAAPPPPNWRASVLVITDFGREVLSRKADAVAFNGIDRWIGGVHLQGDKVPRRTRKG